MDWQLVIDGNREKLLRIVAMLFSIAGLEDRATVATLPRCTRNYLYRLLRPAESAVRRLIFIAARGLKLDVHPARSVILGLDAKTSGAPSSLARTHSVKPPRDEKTENTASTFPLLDPMKRFDFAPRRRYATKSFPRISIIGVTEPRPIPEKRLPLPEDPLDATHICRRLAALKHALDTLDSQARRLARWKALRDMALKSTDPNRRRYRLSPMRPGYPPGYRRRKPHEIDEILEDLQLLALYAQENDTS